jgi:hypothetical protein
VFEKAKTFTFKVSYQYKTVKSYLKFKLSSDTKSIWHRKLPVFSHPVAQFPLHDDKVKKAFKPFRLSSFKIIINDGRDIFPPHFQNEIFLQFI